MISVKVDDVTELWKSIVEKNLAEKFGVKISPPANQPYGKEVNIIDIAGVCWHFIQ